METENSNTPKQRSTSAYNKVVFVEYSSAKPGQHFMTIMKNVDGKRRIIGKIYREYDKENKKAIYGARDWAGVPVFTDIPDLVSLKKSFIEHAETIAQSIPKDPKEVKDKELEDIEREADLNEIRERNTGKDDLEMER